MGKRFAFAMIFGVFLVCMCLVGEVSASDTIAGIDWRISHVTNLQNVEVGYSRPILSLDVDLGFDYLNLYGTMCSEDGIDCIAVNGAGYLYNTVSGTKVKMDARAGIELLRIELDTGSLEGIVSIYDQDGQFEAAGSLELLQVY